jgi:hypothetical protein
MSAQGGPPPGWPAPPAGAYGPGFTQVGEPGFTPSFPPQEGGVPGPMAPPRATVVDPGVGMEPIPAAAAPVMYPAPVQNYVPPAAPPKSRVPMIIGIGAIMVGAAATGAFLYTRHADTGASDADTATPATPPAKKSAAPEKTAEPAPTEAADAKADTPTTTEAPPATEAPPPSAPAEKPTTSPQQPPPQQHRPPPVQPPPQTHPSKPPSTQPTTPPMGHGTIPLPHH